MAINLRPQTDSLHVVWHADEAIDTGPYLKDDGKGGTKVDFATLMEAYSKCVDHMDFSPMLKPGERPTTFEFRPLATSKMEAIRKFTPIAMIKEDGEPSFVTEACWLAFRSCLIGIDNLTVSELADYKPRADSAYRELGALVPTKWCDLIDQVARQMGHSSLTTSIGAVVLARAMPGMSPKS